ncbi:MAG TPA: PAAR domain-containing protein [Alphaproteobacteria bacterium]|nr:PAAR domain-containing protein [Alphaproteobacteria bacterium]
MPPVARITDLGSHGGAITTGSPNVMAGYLPVARLTDVYTCTVHPPNPIVTCSTTVFANYLGVVRIGDLTTCTAAISTGDITVIVGG